MRMAEHMSSLWVALWFLSRLEWLAEHVLRMWVTLWSLNHWWEWLNMTRMWVPLWFLNHWCVWLNMHQGCELLSDVWADWKQALMRMAEHASRVWVVLECLNWNYWWEWLNTHPASESLMIETADQNGWTCIQQVSLSRITDRNGLTHVQFVSCSLVVEESLMRPAELASSGKSQKNLAGLVGLTHK